MESRLGVISRDDKMSAPDGYPSEVKTSTCVTFESSMLTIWNVALASVTAS